MKRILSVILTAFMLTSLFGLSAIAEDMSAPYVNIDTLTDGELYSREDVELVEISAEGADGSAIAQVVLNVDFEEYEVFDTSPCFADLSDIPSGLHYIEAVATDANGLCASQLIRIIIEEDTTMMSIYNYDFTDYVSEGTSSYSGASVQFGTVNATSRGDALIKSVNNSEKYGEAHGVVAEITGSGTEYDEGAKRFLNNGAYTQIGINSAYATATVEIEFDMWLESVPQQFEIGVRDTAKSSISTDITILPTGINFAGDRANSVSKIDWSLPEYTGWYHFAYTVNAGARVYSCTITREGETEPFAQTTDSKMALQTISGAQGLRITMKVNKEGQTTLTALDNISMSVAVGETVISGVTADVMSENGKIAPESTSVAVELTNGLNSATVTTDNVKVYTDNREVIVDSISFDGNLVINFSEKLQPDKIYTIILADTIADSLNNLLGGGRKCCFMTSYAASDAINLSLVSDDNGSRVTGTMIDFNNSGKTLYTVLTVWNGDRMTDIVINPITWSDGASFTTGYVNVADGETVSFAVWDRLYNPTVLLKDINK